MNQSASRMLPKLKVRLITAPQQKRAKRDNSRPATLTSLPDGVLALVMRQLCGLRPHEALQGRKLLDARHAFTLAQCSTRLMRVFCTGCLSRVNGDVRPAEIDLHFGTDAFRLTAVQKPAHLETIARLAGESLREMCIPRYTEFSASVDCVLASIIDFCPNVKKLSCPGQQVENEVLFDVLQQLGPNLQDLRIHSPSRDMITALAWAEECSLSALVLDHVEPRDGNAILAMLEKRGARLLFLRISFSYDCGDWMDETSLVTIGERESDRCCIRKFLSFLDENLPRACPRLTHLDVAIVSPSNCSLEYISTVADAHRLLAERMNQTICANQSVDASSAMGLKSLRIWGTATSASEFMHMSKHVSALERYEIHVPGATIVFPVDSVSVGRPFFQAIRLGDVDMSVITCMGLKGMLSRVEVISLSSSFFSGSPAHVKKRQDMLHVIGTRAAQYITSLRMDAVFTSATAARTASAMLENFLYASQRAVFVEIPCSLIAYSQNGNDLCAGVMKDAFRRVQCVRLVSPGTLAPTNAGPNVTKMFLEQLPAFMDVLLSSCKNLEAFYVSDLGGIDDRHDRRTIRQLARISCNVVEELEHQYFGVDLSPILAQLRFWLQQCY